jgi:hypothetical protein
MFFFAPFRGDPWSCLLCPFEEEMLEFRSEGLPSDLPIFSVVGTDGKTFGRKLLSRRSSVGRAADS